MKIIKGIIREIYLPNEFINGLLVDELYRKHIGFKLEIGGKIYKFETMQTEESCGFFRNEIVGIVVDQNKIIKLVKVK